MKKRLFMFATAALMLSACSNDGEVAMNDGAAQLQSGSGVVAFDTYTSSATKAGATDVMNTTTLKTQGFGVFAQYSNDGDYSKTVNPSNFMWNQKVHNPSGAWTYEPLKYWPNETTNDSQTPTTATSSKTDKLSFFAYAPYVAEPTGVYDGKLVNASYYDDAPTIANSNIKDANKGGIEAVIANNATGYDPWVRYTVADKPSESVDLLWGVAPAGGLHYTAVDGNDIDVDAGEPLINLVKPAKDQKIKFLFQHALARIGMTVVYAADQISAGGELKDETKIAVKQVDIIEVASPLYRLATSGALNLKNTTAYKSLWSNTDGIFSGSIKWNDDPSELNPDIAYKTDAGTTWSQTGTWTGVTNTETDVIKGKKYYMVIPTHVNTDLQVTITYDVITKDPKLNGSYSEVENVITKKITIPALTNNKAYNLKLILGMTSVKLDAEVADWEIDGSNEVYLPQNTAE